MVAHLRAKNGYLCRPEDCKLFRKKDKLMMLAYVEHKNRQYNDACTRKGLIIYLDRKKAEREKKDVFVPIWIGTENPYGVRAEIEEYNAINGITE